MPLHIYKVTHSMPEWCTEWFIDTHIITCSTKQLAEQAILKVSPDAINIRVKHLGPA